MVVVGSQDWRKRDFSGGQWMYILEAIDFKFARNSWAKDLSCYFPQRESVALSRNLEETPPTPADAMHGPSPMFEPGKF
jgi:hypothetical protein